MNQETEKTELETLIDFWKKNNIKEVVLTFDCGGDSMNSMEWEVFTNKGVCKDNSVNNELIGYFEDDIFKKIDFYECSDGHYIGESGTVSITLDDGDEDFYYSKDATSEFNETKSESLEIQLSPEEFEFMENFIESMESEDGDNVFTQYKKDFIMTVEQEQILKNLENKFDEEAREHTFNEEDESSEWYRWSYTDWDSKKKSVEITVERTFIIFQPSED